MRESIEGLAIRPGGVYVDATFGGGGHAKEILGELGDGRLVGFDQDGDAMENRIDDPRLVLVNNNFRFLRNFLKLHKAVPVDGILADLGVSSHQIDAPERGFSTRFEGDLDMRMDRRKPGSARDIVNSWSEEELASLFRRYGDIQNSRKLASHIAERRKQSPIETTQSLTETAAPCAIRGKENKYMAQLFQALRIEVNQEMEALREFLQQSAEVLRPGGRLVVISYHSLEDKLVKNFLRSGKFEGEAEKDFYGNLITPFSLVTRKAVVASDEEIEMNGRARSARLRIAEKR